MVTVSVIVPVYNAEQTLERCLEAILNQTFNDFEIICVNDGSQDSSWNLLEKYAQKDSRIKIYNQENCGVAFTRNHAISKSIGKYIMFCDADDYYEPKMIEEMVHTIEKQNVDVVMCDANIIDLGQGQIQKKSEKRYIKIKQLGLHDITPNFLNKINVVLWNKIFKRDLLERSDITYPLKYEHDDMAFVYMYLAAAKTYYGIPSELYHYFVGNENSIMGQCYTNRNRGKEFDFIYAFEEIFKFLDKHPNDEYKEYVERHVIDIFNIFIKYIDKSQQIEAYKILRNFVINSGYFTHDIDNTLLVKNTEDYKLYVKKSKNKNVTFLQQIFSVKNENNHKVLRILGFKISFERKRFHTSKMFIVYHKPSQIFSNGCCVPINGGRADLVTKNILNEDEKAWLVKNTIGDNSGDNISSFNSFISEGSVIYWVWKNYENNEVGNPDIVGFMHYRTLFMLHTYPQYNSNYLDSCGYDSNYINYLLRDKKAITGHWVKTSNSQYTMYKNTSGGHNIVYYDALLNIIKTKFKKDYKDFYRWSMSPNQGGPFKNMFIMRKKDFFKYCEWIFPIILEFLKEFEHYEYSIPEEKRNAAWLLELLTAYYFDKYIGINKCRRMTIIRPI